MWQIPELQHIVETMLKSLPELGNVVIVLCFLFALFGILGMQLYSGRQHFRCRLTPYPVTLDWSPDLDDALDFHRSRNRSRFRSLQHRRGSSLTPRHFPSGIAA